VVCLDEDPYLFAVGAYYENFQQTTDDDVIALLDRAREWYARPRKRPTRALDPAIPELAVEIEVGRVRLEGNLKLPDGAKGLVLFAHGSGSSRHSHRNRFVASDLQRAGFATLLFDLLTEEEGAEDDLTGRHRFDVDFLASRLLDATTWTTEQPEMKSLRIGYFGSSTGAAAALIAAAQRPDLVSAIVSRGGRPDLAGSYLDAVVAPTLLIVGSADREVLALNEEALKLLRGPRELVTSPASGRSH
jgi:putative phosphoribosyl transferase